MAPKGVRLTSSEGDDEGHRPILAAADAATAASRDAVAAARAAADTTVSAQEAATTAGDVATRARHATASTVAAAASAAAEVAARAATAVQAEASSRALEVAASAVKALEVIAADLSEDVDPDSARRVAALVAGIVAADVIAQARLTDDAAARVAEAVAVAADAAALAAVAAASVVAAAAGTAKTSAHEMAGASAASEVASELAVESAGRAAKLALSRVALLRQAPMVAELQQALDRDELQLHYQPMYSMETNAIVGVEALIRWQHPTRGLLLPADFLKVAEGPHLVTPVGDWVLQAAVLQAAEWQRSLGTAAPVMWVNISCDQLGRDHLTAVVEQLLSAADLAPTLLGIEVTERQLARRVDDVADDLLVLRKMGVALAVDDYGTGYASLDYLRRFTFDEIKIDRSFVSGLQDRTNLAVTTSIVALARSLDLTVVGEGVETQAQFDRLLTLGCDVAQGYLMQRPSDADTITGVLNERIARAVQGKET